MGEKEEDRGMTRTETAAAVREFISLVDGDDTTPTAIARCETLDSALRAEYLTGSEETHGYLLRYARRYFGGVGAWMDTDILPEDEEEE
jgi:hypothetical protein